MKLKKKVSRTSARSPEQAAAEEAHFLRSIESRISALQFATGASEGLASIFSFLEGENEGEQSEEMDLHHLCGGLYQITAALHRCLLRETNAMEREVWDRKGPARR